LNTLKQTDTYVKSVSNSVHATLFHLLRVRTV